MYIYIYVYVCEFGNNIYGDKHESQWEGQQQREYYKMY